MWLKSLRVRSYKSISDSGELELSPRMTVLVGQNSSGKTAFLECAAIGGRGSVPHRSVRATPDPWDAGLPTSATYNISGEGAEIRSWARRVNNVGFWMKAPTVTPESFLSLWAMYEGGPFSVRCDDSKMDTQHPYLGVTGVDESSSHDLALTADHGRVTMRGTGASGQALSSILFDVYQGRHSYFVGAERLTLAAGPVAPALRLDRRAENLSSCVARLAMSNPDLFAKFSAAVGRILPSVRQVTAPPVVTNSAEVRIWPTPASSGREDLAVSLAACGTGVGQVLAIVYLLLTTPREQCTLIIDEPSSFLHPAATAELFRLLREHPEKQYIIATQNPEVVALADPERIYLFRNVDGETKIDGLSPRQVSDQRRVLLELGLPLAAVFGAESILWVEGPTEAAVLRLVLDHFDGERNYNSTRLLPIVDTGGFEKKDVGRVAKMYRSVSLGSALLPPTIGFLLDGEGRSPADKAAMEEAAPEPMHFLSRRMIENYLLHPPSIAAVLRDGVPGESCEATDVEGCLRVIGTDEKRRLNATKLRDVDAAEWERSVHAGDVLHRVFVERSGTKLEYSKVAHGIELASHILASDPALLRPLYDEVVSALEAMRAKKAPPSA